MYRRRCGMTPAAAPCRRARFTRPFSLVVTCCGGAHEPALPVVDPARRHPIAFRARCERPRCPRAGSGSRDPGAPLCASASWLSGTRLQLAQGHAPSRGSGLSRGRPRSARLRTHHGLECRLRRGRRFLPHPADGPRRHGADCGTRLSPRGCGDRPRFRIPRGSLVVPRAARYLPFGGPHECPVRRPTGVAVRHRSPGRPRGGPPMFTRRSLRSTGRASITSGTTPNAAPMPTCGIARRASMRSSAPTTT